MKLILRCASLLMAGASVASAQGPSATKSKMIDGETISIVYNSPKVNGREGQLFGKDGRIGKDPNYPIWRAGANAATKLHTDANLKVGDVEVPRGITRFTLISPIPMLGTWSSISRRVNGV